MILQPGHDVRTDSGIAVLMDKGIVIGVEHEAATRSNLPFVMFRHVTSVSFILSVLRELLAYN